MKIRKGLRTQLKPTRLRPRKALNYSESPARNRAGTANGANQLNKTHSAAKTSPTRCNKKQAGATVSAKFKHQGTPSTALEAQASPAKVRKLAVPEAAVENKGANGDTIGQMGADKPGTSKLAADKSFYDDTIESVVENSTALSVKWTSMRPVPRQDGTAKSLVDVAHHVSDVVESARSVRPKRSQPTVLSRSSENPLFSGIPCSHPRDDVHRDPKLKRNLECEQRATFAVRSLAGALFGDDACWKGTWRKSCLSVDNLIFYYKSVRWEYREIVWVPYGKAVQTGDVPYTCATCFRYGSYLRAYKGLKRKLPVVIVRDKHILDDPDWPLIEHLCDSSTLTEEEKSILSACGVNESHVTSKAATRPISSPVNNDYAGCTSASNTHLSVNAQMTVRELLSQHSEELLFTARERVPVSSPTAGGDSQYRKMPSDQASPSTVGPSAGSTDSSLSATLEASASFTPTTSAIEDEGMVNVNEYLTHLVEAAVAKRKDKLLKPPHSIKREIDESALNDPLPTTSSAIRVTKQPAAEVRPVVSQKDEQIPWKIKNSEVEKAAHVLREAMRTNAGLLTKFDKLMCEYSGTTC